jgi:hypothetical protein
VFFLGVNNFPGENWRVNMQIPKTPEIRPPSTFFSFLSREFRSPHLSYFLAMRPHRSDGIALRAVEDDLLAPQAIATWQ